MTVRNGRSRTDRAVRSSQNRRAEILDLAAELFAKQGVDRTTMREIGNAVGMLPGSLYHYFDSKEAIVPEIVTGYLAKRLEACRHIAAEHPDPRSRLAALLNSELIDVAQSAAARVVNSQSVYVLGLLPYEPTLRDLAVGIREIWMETITSGISAGFFRSDVDPELFYAFARKTSSLALQMWIGALGNGPEPVASRYGNEGVAASWIKILLHGFEMPE